MPGLRTARTALLTIINMIAIICKIHTPACVVMDSRAITVAKPHRGRNASLERRICPDTEDALEVVRVYVTDVRRETSALCGFYLNDKRRYIIVIIIILNLEEKTTM